MTAKRWDIVKKKKGWVAETKSGNVVVKAEAKSDVVRKTAARAKRGTRPVTVRIHKRNGRIGEERTYPRSADPRSTS